MLPLRWNGTRPPDEFASDEIRAALTLTRRAAETDLGLGFSVCERLPRVREALEAGLIDLRKARTVVWGSPTWILGPPARLLNRSSTRRRG